jgi:hypothetical protein
LFVYIWIDDHQLIITDLSVGLIERDERLLLGACRNVFNRIREFTDTNKNSIKFYILSKCKKNVLKFK